jgi:protein MpaA
MNKVTRDYNLYIQKLTALHSASFQLEQTGQTGSYPLYQVTIESAAATDWVLITAGVHGDEPAGPEAILHFLGRDNRALFQRFNFFILPCINPHGYERNTRENSNGSDLNRSFEADIKAEVGFVKAMLKDRRFCCTIDFHEDWEATGFYLYEARRNALLMGEELLREVEKIGPIDTDTGGDEGDVALAPGHYPVALAWGTSGLVPYLYHFHTDHALNTETPTQWPLEQRVAAHLKLLDGVLERHTLTEST